jgi:hypothetical protein
MEYEFIVENGGRGAAVRRVFDRNNNRSFTIIVSERLLVKYLFHYAKNFFLQTHLTTLVG